MLLPTTPHRVASGFLASLSLALGLVLTIGGAIGAARQDDPGAEPPVRRATADVPLFAGPATLDLTGRAGQYSWDELHVGSDRVRLRLVVRGQTSPCGLYLAFADWMPWATSRPPRVISPASPFVTAAPLETATSDSDVIMGYATVSLRVLSTCPDWSLRLETLPDPDLSAEISEHFYPVHGRTVSQLAAQADQAEDGWTAFTDWRTDWHYRWLDTGTSCSLTGGEVELKARITYPRWRPPEGVASSVTERWDRFMEHLVTHELGHVTIALQGAAAIDDLFDSGLTERTCDELQRATDEAAMQLHKRFEGLNVRYDRVTEHGLAQGTRLP